MLNNETLKMYSEEIQAEVIETLKAYDKCHIERSGETYRVCTAYSLKREYDDEESLDEFNKNDIFTENEQIINYMDSFHAYPITYKGKRDYAMLKEAGWEAKFELDENNNIVVK